MATEAEWKARVIREAGGQGDNAKFEVAFVYGTSGGSMTFEFNGQTTDPLDYPFSAEQLKTALGLLSTIGENGVKVNGAVGGPFVIEMVGANAGQDVPALSADGSSLIPQQDVEVQVLQMGESSDWSDAVDQLWTDHADKTGYLRFLYVKLGLFDLRLEKLALQVDTRTGAQVTATEIKYSQAYDRLSKERARVDTAILFELTQAQQPARRTAGSVMRNVTPNGLPYGVMAYNPANGRVR